MKTSFVFISFFFLVLGLLIPVNSQTDSCSSSLNLNGQLPFDTTTFHCNPVWAAQGFILRYSQDVASNVWSFVLSAPNPDSYIAIGFSSDGKMVGSSSIVGWVMPGGTPIMKRYYLGGQSPEKVVVDQGSLPLTNTSKIVPDSSHIHMAFQLNTNQPQSRLIYAVGQAGRYPGAGPDYVLFQHSDVVSTSFNFVTGQTKTVSPYKSLRRSHGVLNMLGWGVLMPIGVMVARYLKQMDPIWFYSHICIQLFGFIFGVAGVICGFVLEDKLAANVKKHKGLGVFILTLGCLQVLAFLARPDKGSKYRKYWNWYHYSVGRVLIFFAAINIFYGIHLGSAGSGWNAGYGIVLAGLFLVAVVLELRMRMRN
ncbi:cytochrome b561 and DOMON domain-containing protein At3g07570 [Cornus florida]|uniref:cytochrome b561 and DOMON domain-containing protein At3g07570 n=1 Tax=Cornus florida TaxID=4283 RepID=UPI002896FF76|nr:cytochrome b561 and DOMON domain-containing protein At3g07570 [Cornus florida]